MNPYKKLFKSLEKGKVNYLIVDGVAVNLYGYPRFTGDIDILLALDKANLKKLENVMVHMEYTERLPVKLIELRDKKGA